MEKLEWNEKKSSPFVLFITLHAMFTVLLLVGMAHIQIQMTQHIAQQERENAILREMLNKHVHMQDCSNKGENTAKDAKANKEEPREERATRYETMESKEVKDAEENVEQEELHGVDVNPLILRIKRAQNSKCCGKGSRGRKGQKGERGRKGRRGEKGEKGDAGVHGTDGTVGHRGRRGTKGDKGAKGAMGVNGVHGHDGRDGQQGRQGAKGYKGEKGESTARNMFAQSAHIVGRGRTKKPDKIVKNSDGNKVYLMTWWITKHETSQMSYTNGFLNVGVEGYYYIYAQINYNDKDPVLNGYMLCIEGKPVIQALNSVISSTRKFNTNYIGGVFHINAGQKISVRTNYNQKYEYAETKSYFGAFMIHS